MNRIHTTRRFPRRYGRVLLGLVLLAVAATVERVRGGEPAEPLRAASPVPLEEARARARLLHETVNGALQVMHRDLFDEEAAIAIPSRSLEDVFQELARGHGVELRWLAVNATALNVDHKPRTPFERAAAAALAEGEAEFEAAEEETYRFAGSIRLRSQCLKCHVPGRTSTEDRFAGLLISLPLKSVARDSSALESAQ